MHSSRMLWRDACALSKAVHESAVNLYPGRLDVDEHAAGGLVQQFHAKLARTAVRVAATQTPRATPKNTPSRVNVINGGQPGPNQGMLLGRTQPPSLLGHMTPQAWLSEQGLLDQVAVYGGIGSGRQATVLTMAMNFATVPPTPNAHHYAPAPQHRQSLQRSVVMMDSHGDTTLYARATGSLLARKVDHDALRVINLIQGGGGSSEHPRPSHAIDLFEGMDEHAVENWMRAVLADPDGLTTEARKRVNFVVPAVVRLAVSWCNRTLERLLPSYLGHAMTREGLKEHTLRQGNVGHLAQQLYAQAWGEQADPLIARTLNEIHDYLKPLWTDYAHVFNSSEPEIGLKDVFSTPCFVLVLAPDMERSNARNRLLTRSVTTSLLLAIRKQPANDQAQLMVVLDGFHLCLAPADVAPWRGVGKHATGVVWTDYRAIPLHHWGKPNQDSDDVLYWPTESGAPATHLFMPQHPSRLAINHEHYTQEILRIHSHKNPTRAKEAASMLFEGLNTGEAVVESQGETMKITMAYLEPHLPDSSSLARLPILENNSYGLSGGEVVLAPISHQARVLQQRLAQLAQTQPGARPTLAWAQETVARMLGFSHWHEASQRLGKTPVKPPA